MLRKKKLEELKRRLLHKEEFPEKPVEINDGNFDAFVSKYRNVVIDCWAPWCGPCLMIAPVIEELAKELKGKVIFGKLNVDENQKTALRYRIMSIPTLLIFKEGRLVDRLVGAMPKEGILQNLKNLGMI